MRVEFPRFSLEHTACSFCICMAQMSYHTDSDLAIYKLHLQKDHGLKPYAITA